MKYSVSLLEDGRATIRLEATLPLGCGGHKGRRYHFETANHRASRGMPDLQLPYHCPDHGRGRAADALVDEWPRKHAIAFQRWFSKS
jgi:hypothetical protein